MVTCIAEILLFEIQFVQLWNIILFKSGFVPCRSPITNSAQPPEPVEMSIAEQQELGYMPLRDDFEKVTTAGLPLTLTKFI